MPTPVSVAIEYNGEMALDLTRIRALCFDVDGTLSDSDDYYVAALSLRLQHVPFVLDPHQTARRIIMWMESPANSLFGLADSMGLDDEIMGVIEWMQRHLKRRHRRLPVMPGVANLLQRVHVRYPLAVVSARDKDSTMAFLEDGKLLQYFDVTITALSAKHTKPYPDPIRLAAQMIGVAAESCLMIGDTGVDMRAGKAAGAQTVGVLCGYGRAAELQRQGADLILPTTKDLDGALLSPGP